MQASRPIKYHRLLLLIGLLLTISMLLAACPAAGPAAPAAPAGEAEATAAPAEEAAAPAEVTRENTLIFAGDMSDLLSLDPAVIYEFSGTEAGGQIYETLVSFEPGQPGVKPLLADSWDIQDTGDMWTVTFKLNPNAKFASGNPITAEDVVYSWGRVLDLNKSPAFLFIDIAQLTKENMKAVDAQTVEVKLPKTASPQVFLSILSFSVAAVVEKAVVEANAGDDFGSTWLNDHSAGSGPYVLDAWERNVQVTMNANPNYWGKAPAMQRVIMQNVTELANLQALIETGDADIVQDLGPEQAAALAGNPDVQVVNADTLYLIYVGMNALKPPLDKPEVREAIRWAINYDDINTLLAGNGFINQGIIPKGLLGFVDTNPFTQDLDKAKELLASAGVAEGTAIDMIIPIGTAPGGIEWAVVAAKIQDDLKKVGLELNIQQMQQSELLNIYRAQEGQIVLINWSPDFPDPDGNVTPFTDYATKSIGWRNGWDNPEIAALAKQAALASTDQERIDLYAQLVDRVEHEGPYAVLFQPIRTFGVRSNIQNFVFDAPDTPHVSYFNLTRQ